MIAPGVPMAPIEEVIMLAVFCMWHGWGWNWIHDGVTLTVPDGNWRGLGAS